MSLRILHVLETCGAGGMETTFLNVLSAWQQAPAWARHDVLAAAGGVLAPRLQALVEHLWIAPDPASIRERLSIPYDVVHVLFERPAVRWIPEIVGRTTAAVVYGKGYDMGGTFRVNDGLRWQPDESVMWGSDRVTFTTTALAERYDMPPERRVVLGKAAAIHRFVDLPLPSAVVPDRIVCIANLHALKRLGDLVRAVAGLVAECPSVRLRVVGADHTGEAVRLKELARSLGVADRCEFPGRHEDVSGDLAESRIFALPSGREGVPTAMLEAMAAGRPVVVSDVGHIRGVVREGVDGYLFAVGDVGALTSRLRELLMDRALAARLGAAARERAAVHDVAGIAGRLRAVLTAAPMPTVMRGAAA